MSASYMKSPLRKRNREVYLSERKYRKCATLSSTVVYLKLTLGLVLLLPMLWSIEEAAWSRGTIDSFPVADSRRRTSTRTATPLFPSLSGKLMIPYREARNHSRYCYWKPSEDTLQGCVDLLLPVLQGRKRWTMLGDSTIRLLFVFAEHLYPRRRKVGRRCHQELYFGFPENPRTLWIEPNHSKSEGPVNFGAKKGNEYCADCSGCSSEKKEGMFNRSLEFLSVEFAKDVEVPTAYTRTTQETVALYFEREVQNATDHVCVVNNGLHGMTVFNETSKYVENNRWFLDRLLKSKCGYIVWISMTATAEIPPFEGLNSKLKEWNDSLRNVLRTEYPQVFYVDVWDKSMVTEHNDNVHLKNAKFYEPLASSLFVKLMEPTSLLIPFK